MSTKENMVIMNAPHLTNILVELMQYLFSSTAVLKLAAEFIVLFCCALSTLVSLAKEVENFVAHLRSVCQV